MHESSARTAVTIDGCGEPLAVSRTARAIPSAIRTALNVRDRGCRFPGCDRPPEWTEATISTTGSTAVRPASTA